VKVKSIEELEYTKLPHTVQWNLAASIEKPQFKKNLFETRKCTLWRCKSTPTPKANLLWMTSHYGPTVVRSVTEIPFNVFI